jgi:flagellar basal-body rod protein FlgG
MMRALYTAGSGMVAQQFNVDVISNNLANVNTTSYKKQRAEFKDLLYENLDRAYMLNNSGKPVNLEVGHGTTVAATVKDFSIGNFEKTDNPLDVAINGEAFFSATGPTGDTVYTRDGSFKVSVTDTGKKLTTSDGSPVLDTNGQEIPLDTAEVSKLNIASNGALSYTDNTGATVDLGQSIGLFKFSNVQGLQSLGQNFYTKTSASGDPVADTDFGTQSTLQQNFLESSNVQVVEEMVKMIVAQRAYDTNSKAIQSVDEMLQTANALKR